MDTLILPFFWGDRMNQQKTIDLLNQLAADLGLFGSRRSSFIYWRIPKGWKGTKYEFGYTPWRTRDPDTGEEGFFALKYRVLKDGSSSLSRRCGLGEGKLRVKEAGYGTVSITESKLDGYPSFFGV